MPEPRRNIAVAIRPVDAQGALAIGNIMTFSKTVGESDVYLFAGVSGDLSPNHCNEEYMAKTRYGKRIAHGALLVAYMSACSTRSIETDGQYPDDFVRLRSYSFR